MGSSPRPGLPGQFLGDHHDPRSIRRVALCEQLASREPHAKEPQVIRRHDPMTGDRHIVRIDDRSPLDRVKRIERRTLQGDVGR